MGPLKKARMIPVKVNSSGRIKISKSIKLRTIKMPPNKRKTKKTEQKNQI